MFEKEILNVYKKCGIHDFPFPCIPIFQYYGYSVKTYIEAASSTQQLRTLHSFSTDAFTDYNSKTVFYNDSIGNKRIRFSLMHELGHIILGSDNDFDADTFSGGILAPRSIVYAMKIKTAEDISKQFGISITAANRVAGEMKLYWPDLNEAEIIEYFGYRSKCLELFPIPQQRENDSIGSAREELIRELNKRRSPNSITLPHEEKCGSKPIDPERRALVEKRYKKSTRTGIKKKAMLEDCIQRRQWLSEMNPEMYNNDFGNWR